MLRVHPVHQRTRTYHECWPTVLPVLTFKYQDLILLPVLRIVQTYLPDMVSHQIISAAALLAFAAPLLVVAHIFYNLFLHPLRHYPGPLSCRATILKWMIVQCSGDSRTYIQAQHAKYGTIVRIEPNMLSFADPEAYYDIYGHKTTTKNPGLPPSGYLPKSSFARRDTANGYYDIVSSLE